MEGLTIAILVITLLSAFLFTWLNRQGSGALAPVAGEFPFTPERAAEIALEAGLTSRERALGTTVPVVHTVGGLRFEIECRAGVMAFEFHSRPGSDGCLVTGRAEEIAVTGFPGPGGSGASATNVLYLTLSVPRNPAALLRRRERVFGALARAARGDGQGGAGAPVPGPARVDEVSRC